MRALRLVLPALALHAFVSCAESPTAVEVSVSLNPETTNATVLLTRQFTAVVGGTSNQAVTWSVQEGASGGSVSAAGLYTAPATPGTYHVIATSVEDATKSDTSTVTVVDAPVITAFTAAKGTISTGGNTTLTATFTGGTGTINQGVGAVATGAVTPTGALTATRTYQLRVANIAGTEVTADVTVTVVPLPTLTSFTATPAHIATGTGANLMAVFANGVATLTPGGGAMVSGVVSGTGNLTTTTNYRVVVKNAADDSVFATTTVTVYAAPPAINSFTATPAIITVGDSTTLAWNVDSALSYTIDAGVGAVTGTTKKVAPVGGTTYTLSATNPVGTTTAMASVTVVFAPIINSFVARPGVITTGGSTYLIASYQHGTGSVDNGLGAVAHLDSVASGALNANTTYTLTVTNPAGRTVTAQATVNVDPGSFATTGSMNALRNFWSMVPLSDGSVLALGGSDFSGNPNLSSAETYDPVGGTWTPTAGTLNVGRNYPEAVLLADGRVLVSGGINGGATVRSAEIYDPATRTFTMVDSMGVARIQHTLVLLADGRVLAFGGGNSGTPNLLTAEIYDPRANTWTPTGGLGNARQEAHAYALSNGNIVVLGGGAGTASAYATEIYDRALGIFTPAGGQLMGQVAAERLLDGSILGVTNHGFNRRWLNGATTDVPSFNKARLEVASIVLLGNGEILMQGDTGTHFSSGNGNAEIYNPTTNSWRYTARPNHARLRARMALLRSGKALVAGGFENNVGLTATTELFDVGGATPVAVPSATVTAPGGVTGNSSGIAISVPATPGARYFWMVSGGTITAGLATNAITVTAGASGSIEVRVLVVSELHIPATGSASIPITP